jgi:hypothetical protein
MDRLQKWMVSFLFVPMMVLALTACRGTSAPLPTIMPTSSPPAPTATAEPFSPGMLETLEPEDILVQLDFHPTFNRPEAFHPYGRVPRLTLYANGDLFYVEETPRSSRETVVQAQLSPEETQALLQSVHDLGFDRLESYIEACRDVGDGTQECISDASLTLLRSRTTAGDLREVAIYADFTDHPATLDALVEFLISYQVSEAVNYVPTQATLFISRVDPPPGEGIIGWPLDSRYLAQSRPDSIHAWVLEGQDLTDYLAVVERNKGDAWFQEDDQIYQAYLIPWLPGQDYRSAITSTFPLPATPEPGATSPPIESPTLTECPAPPSDGDESEEGLFRVVFLSDEDLWRLDEGAEPSQITQSGDIRGLSLTPDGGTVVFAKQVGGNAQELWSVDAGGRQPRRLAGAGVLTGTIEIHDFSDDGALVAFTHQIDELNVELWAAEMDGGGARRLISTDNLKAIVQEPLADSATPAQIKWIPGSHTLTYDARPAFTQGGLYIYVPRQIWAVDADTGERRPFLPPGEGGMLSFSPDGEQVAIMTPEELDLLTLEGMQRKDTDVDYEAVGFGESYFYPPLAWTPDSDTLLLAQPVGDGTAQNGAVAIYRIPAGGSPSEVLGGYGGFSASFHFSPDLEKVAYWQAEPESNFRSLHTALVGGPEDIVYHVGELVEFAGWSPDSRHFVYWDANGTARLGDLCGPDEELTEFPARTTPFWLDADHFLYVSDAVTGRRLHLMTLDGDSTPLGLLDKPGDFDFTTLAPPEPTD